MSHRVHVLTFKQGLLSRVAHDLQLSIQRFAITRDGDAIVGRFEASSLIVDGVMADGRCDPSRLTARDRASILETVQTEILQTWRHPSVEFRGRAEPDAPDTGQGARLRVEGELELLGVRRPIAFTAIHAGERITAAVTLRPSDYGVRPYRALAGAIRLQDRVRVELDLDAAALALEAPA